MSQKNLLEIKKIIKNSWSIFKSRFWKIAALLLIVSSPTILISIAQAIFAALSPQSIVNTTDETQINFGINNSITFVEPRNSIFLIVWIIASLVAIYLTIGLIKAQFKLVDKEAVSTKIFGKTPWSQYGHYILSLFLIFFVALVVILIWVLPWIASARYMTEFDIGAIITIFAVVRGVLILAWSFYLIIKLQFFKFFIAKGETAINSFKKSWEITKWHERKLFLLGLVVFLIVFAWFFVLILLVVIIAWIGSAFWSDAIWFTILAILLGLLLLAVYLAMLVWAFSTSELSLTQAFVSLNKWYNDKVIGELKKE